MVFPRVVHVEADLYLVITEVGCGLPTVDRVLPTASRGLPTAGRGLPTAGHGLPTAG